MTPIQAPQAQLKEARNILLRLHKTLLEHERDRYELTQKKINSTNEYLQLVLNDRWFAWLRIMSGLIVQIDEAFDVKDPRMSEEIALLLGAQIRKLLRPGATETDFSANYERALQQSANAAAQHAEIMRQLDVLLGKEV